MTGPLRMFVAASPDYLARHGTPQSAARPASARLPAIPLRADGFSVSLGVRARRAAVHGRYPRRAGSPMTRPCCHQAALAALGPIYEFPHHIQAALAAGQLVTVLEAWTPPFSGFYLYYPTRALMPPSCAVFVDFLKARGRHRQRRIDVRTAGLRARWRRAPRCRCHQRPCPPHRPVPRDAGPATAATPPPPACRAACRRCASSPRARRLPGQPVGMEPDALCIGRNHRDRARRSCRPQGWRWPARHSSGRRAHADAGHRQCPPGTLPRAPASRLSAKVSGTRSTPAGIAGALAGRLAMERRHHVMPHRRRAGHPRHIVHARATGIADPHAHRVALRPADAPVVAHVLAGAGLHGGPEARGQRAV